MESSISRKRWDLHFIKGTQKVPLEIFQLIRARRENNEMVKWIGKFSLHLKRLRDAWMDSLLTSRFSDKLSTLMFVVASDLSEAQRERLMSALSLQGMDVTACTFDAVRKVYLWNCSAHRKVQWRQHERNLHRRLLCWRWSWTMCHWRINRWARSRWNEGPCFWTWDNNEYWVFRLLGPFPTHD